MAESLEDMNFGVSRVHRSDGVHWSIVQFDARMFAEFHEACSVVNNNRMASMDRDGCRIAACGVAVDSDAAFREARAWLDGMRRLLIG